MSGLMLASSCSAVGAEAPKGIKDRIVNSVVNHKKLILTGAAINAVAGGAVIWLLTHNNNIKMDYSKFTDFENFFGNFKKAAKAFRKSLTVSNIKVSDANKLASTLLVCNNEESESTKKIVIEGIDGLGDDVQGTLVLEKTKKSDGISVIKFTENKKAENKKAEKKEEEKKEETDVNPEGGAKKEENENQGENESQEPKVEKDKEKTEGQVAKEGENKKEDSQDNTESNENNSKEGDAE